MNVHFLQNVPCLDARLIAAVLGTKVSRNRVKEIGWYPVKRSVNSAMNNIIKDISKNLFKKKRNYLSWQKQNLKTSKYDFRKSFKGNVSQITTKCSDE